MQNLKNNKRQTKLVKKWQRKVIHGYTTREIAISSEETLLIRSLA